ncbi:MAG: hypothetical protein PF508_15490 [Spirochaeta sp.]|jgi:flagellar motor switch protein FliM|nr:hypothetical protein [Spirochaeta sp.]
MSETLSQDQIDHLLTTLEFRDYAESPGHEPEPYDFGRPLLFSRRHILTTGAIHEDFALWCGPHLSSVLRAGALVHVASVDQMTYEEFRRSFPTPTPMAVLTMSPLSGSVLLEIDPAVTASIVEHMCGGAVSDICGTPAYTDIQNALLHQAVAGVLPGIQYAWAPLLQLNPTVIRIQTNPAVERGTPSSMTVLVVSFDICVGAVEGHMRMCLPYATVEPILDQLSQPREQRGTPVASVPARGIMDSIELEAEVWTAPEQLNLGSLENLGVGDLIALPEVSRGQLHLDIGGTTVCDIARHDEGPLEAIPRTPAPQVKKPPVPLGLEEELREPPAQPSYQNVSADLANEEPLRWLKRGEWEPSILAKVLSREHPQTIAMVLADVPPVPGAHIARELPEDVQTDVMARLTSLGAVDVTVLLTVSQYLHIAYEGQQAAESAAAERARRAGELLDAYKGSP